METRPRADLVQFGTEFSLCYTKEFVRPRKSSYFIFLWLHLWFAACINDLWKFGNEFRTSPMSVQLNWAGVANDTIEDRRDGKRVSLQFGLEISGTDPSGAPFTVQGRTRNVSQYGCCFEVARCIVPGEQVSLKVIRRNGQGSQEATAALPFRLSWVLQEGNVWVTGAEMVRAETPWGITFPEKPATVKV
jgi:PilZ domain